MATTQTLQGYAVLDKESRKLAHIEAETSLHQKFVIRTEGFGQGEKIEVNISVSQPTNMDGVDVPYSVDGEDGGQTIIKIGDGNPRVVVTCDKDILTTSHRGKGSWIVYHH
ncbi:hypothetical protein FRC09_019025 [Ceratobasidium sp. 395]|nr:hypothetical protein FRC09_019025 [Ceratobasidium sp. 395]